MHPILRKCLPAALASGLLLASPPMAEAQTKRPVTHDDYDSWQSVASVSLSPDGRFLLWSVNEQEGDRTFFIRSVETGREVAVERGTLPLLDPAGRWVYLTVKPLFSQTRQARIKKAKPSDMPKDSLAVVDLSTLTVKRYPSVKRVASGFEAMPYVAYSYEGGSVILDPSTGVADTVRHADLPVVSRNGERMAMVLRRDNKPSAPKGGAKGGKAAGASKADSLAIDGICIYDPVSRRLDTIDRGAHLYKGLTFSMDGAKIAYLSSRDSVVRGSSPRYSLHLYDYGSASSREILPAENLSGVNLPGGWILGEHAAPYFSASGRRIFLGVAPYRSPKDSAIIDSEAAALDIWNWDAQMTPPQQKARREALSSKTYPATVDLSDGRLVVLTTNPLARVTTLGGGDGTWSLMEDDGPYRIASTWDGNAKRDIYKVDYATGEARRIMTALNGYATCSPDGRYMVYYSNDDNHFHSYDMDGGVDVNLSASIPYPVWDEEDDHPAPALPYTRAPLWLDGGRYVVICDRYDLWRVAVDGSESVCITLGTGRRDRVRLRPVDPIDWGFSPSDRRIGLSHHYALADRHFLSAFNEVDMTAGYAMCPDFRPSEPSYFTSGHTYPIIQIARNAPVLAFTRGNFNEDTNLYLGAVRSRKGTIQKTYPRKSTAGDIFGSATRLTDINPQAKEFLWGSVQLVHWKAYDGTQLDGLMFLPEGDWKDKELPMIAYFYERNATTLYSRRAPAPSRSTVNIPYFVSNGYAIFVPDIVYVDGHPGKSAYNCIVSGTEAMCSQFPQIDPARLAIQGQSWGGYQTAYLVTQTDMYAAAGAGAPVGNMTSAYGGIRWESGNVRAVQYEHGQSRIGKSLWDEGGLDLYIENSPIFFVDKVKTPVLIMANDNDGAVPWYQGIEYFMNLRRHGKPSWLLQYNGEAHNLAQRRNARDLSRRLEQFFGHYLKGEPMPRWMSEGVPTLDKDRDWGFE